MQLACYSLVAMSTYYMGKWIAQPLFYADFHKIVMRKLYLVIFGYIQFIHHTFIDMDSQ